MKIEMKKRLLIYGSLLFPFCLPGQTPVIPEIPVRVVNTGKMTVAPNSSGQKTSLYVPHSIRMTGNRVSVVQNGLTAIGGHFYNDVGAGNVFTSGSSGKFRFNGNQNKDQWIQGTANRATSYINFPDVEVDNRASVSLASSMGMNVANLNLKAGRFILRSTEISPTQSQLAHLLVKEGGAVTPNTGSGLSALEKGVVEVELALGTTGRAGKFFGFASPFQKMYTDYLTFKVLLAPLNSGYVSIQNPDYLLQAGKSYFVGQDVFPCSTPQEILDYYPILDTYPLINGNPVSFAQRVTGTLRMNRWHLEVTNPGIAFANGTDAYDGEKLNTQDVNVPLFYGYNYLGNPLTAPLRVNKLFSRVSSATADAWKITRGLDDVASSDPDYLADPDLYAKIWVPATANATNHIPGTHRFTFGTSFLVGQKQGSTLSPSGNGDEIQIAPMQMFVVWTDKPNANITIPASERTHGNMNILKSAFYSPTDELLIQVRDTDTDAIDRFCVLFREGSSINFGDAYDASKLFNRSGGVSQIYNRTPDGVDLSVNQVNTGLEKITLNLLPCQTEKEVELTAHRMETLLSPNRILFEDLLTGETIDLTQTGSYTFTTRPQDREDRFVLHFKSTTGMENAEADNIRIFHHNDMLRVTGLANMDKDSRLAIYNMQGRSIFSTVIKDCTGGRFEIPAKLITGVYIVKISGKRNATEKLIIK
jgi:hypothetical protein